MIQTLFWLARAIFVRSETYICRTNQDVLVWIMTVVVVLVAALGVGLPIAEIFFPAL